MAGRTGEVSGPCGGRPGCLTGSSHGSGSGERANAVSSFTGLVEGGGGRSPPATRICKCPYLGIRKQVPSLEARVVTVGRTDDSCRREPLTSDRVDDP